MPKLFGDALAQRRGRAFHALMEAWPLMDQDTALAIESMSSRPVWVRLLAPFGLSELERSEVLRRARSVLRRDDLREFLGLPSLQSPQVPLNRPGSIATGPDHLIERTWLTPDGRLIRPDWVLRWTEAMVPRLRIVDWKWAVLEFERQAYADQLSLYQSALAHHYPDHQIEAAVLTAEGHCWRLTDQGLVHWSPAGRPAL